MPHKSHLIAGLSLAALLGVACLPKPVFKTHEEMAALVNGAALMLKDKPGGDPLILSCAEKANQAGKALQAYWKAAAKAADPGATGPTASEYAAAIVEPVSAAAACATANVKPVPFVPPGRPAPAAAPSASAPAPAAPGVTP